MKSYQYKQFVIDILYEDEYISILNKPNGLVTHNPSLKIEKASLADSLVNQFGLKIQNDDRQGIVHRLDKDTSGCILICKKKEFVESFQSLFKQRLIQKKYKAITFGTTYNINTVTDKNIVKDKSSFNRYSASENNGKSALTYFYLEKIFFGSISYLSCNLITGRTHQIRVHLNSIGLNLIGDKEYNIKKNEKFLLKNLPQAVLNQVLLFSRQALHAEEINFFHPFLKKDVSILCPLPKDMKHLLKILSNEK